MATQQDFDTIWGSTGAVTEPTPTKQNTGWIAEIPPYQTQNWWQNRVDLQMEYMQERGVAEWNALFNYQAGAIAVGTDGLMYSSVQAANLNHQPVGDSGTWWVEYTTQTSIGRHAIDGFRMNSNGLRGLDFAPGELVMYPKGAVPGEIQRKFSTTTSMTAKQLDDTWTIGAAGGMRHAIAYTAATWYRIFAIGIGATGAIDFGMDSVGNVEPTSLFTIATAYDWYRQIGWMNSGPIGDLDDFYQSPDDLSSFRWQVPKQSLTASNISSTASSVTAHAPPNARAEIYYRTLAANGGNATYYGLISPLAESNILPTSSLFDVRIDRDSTPTGGNNYDGFKTLIDLDVNSQFRHRYDTSSSNANVSVQTTGYRYNRGKE